ncbi:VCBS repeat-containing protein [Vibrio sp. S9_S30]|uniref:FG-GAP repeat domain-containing protein n=1 Tax=Vibrio sp. S9_S30 TaxID=2720226 RepID=UPI001680BF2C|nr:VCBS repeat-containing protein [Vibrio sp. S9_S30]MBD1557252.1 VCBS repeat-containing protein [Vibrio sp. S9_S30]
MLGKLKASSALGMAILLSACGGGDSSSDTAPVNINSNILKNATQYSESELKEAALRLVEQGYSGESQVASLDPSIVRQASNFALDLDFLFIFGDEQIDNFIAIENTFGKSFECGESGFVDINSTLDEQGLGTVSLDFNNCVTLERKTSLSGVLAVSFNDKGERTYYVDNLNVKGRKVTGYVRTHYSTFNESGFELYKETHLLYNINSSGRSIKVSLTTFLHDPDDYGYEDLSAEVNGTVWLGEFGKVDVSSRGLQGSYYPNFHEGSLSFKANDGVKLTFSNDYFTYQEDIDRDGSFDVGTHLSKVSGFQFALTQPIELYPLDLLTLPPAFTDIYASAPTQLSYDLSTATPIVVDSPEFSDPDTPQDELQLSYRWYINGEVVEGETTNVLPAYTAAYGDDVQVQAVVFDGTSSITSNWAYIVLNDTQPVITTDNLPTDVFTGDELQFGVSLFDLDTNGFESVRMESAPDGATISSDGVISWTAPSGSDFLFPVQTFEFTFKSNHDETSEYVLGVEVNSSKAEPLVRSGEYSPSKDDSIIIDDFDGDGLNEFLTTDNESGLSLYSFENGQYKQKWMYPYQLPSNGSIQQVHYLDIDNDLKKEIVIVTSKNILTLEDLSSKPQVVFDAAQYILGAAFADTDNDGVLEVAILHRELFGYDSKLSVYGWNDFSFPVVNEFDVTGSSQLIYSNVDNDEALELVLDGGWVIDTATWDIQWNYQGQFSEGGVAVGDYNQDGVNEIVGRLYGNGNHYYMYSAITNTTTELSSTQYLPRCDLIKAQLTTGATNVLLMDCSYSGIKAFKVEDNTLNQLWSLSSSGNGAINSLTVGDMDNDTHIEMLWGNSGSYSRSGFVSADISANNATLKHTNIEESSSAFRAVGWAKVTPTKGDALYLVGRYNNTSVGNKFAMVGSEGGVKISSGTDYTSYPLFNTVSIDSNEDGYSEIVLPKIDYYNSQIELVELSNDSVTSSHELLVDNDSKIVKSADFNQDGKQDIVLSSGSQITMHDVVNNASIATYQFSPDYTQVIDFEMYDETAGLIVVSEGDNLSLLQVADNSVTVKSTYENSDFGCEKVLVFNHDSDSSKEVACFTEYSNQLLVFEVAENSLALKASYDLNFETIGIAVNTSQLNEQGFIVTTRENTHFGSSSSYQLHVRGLDYKGDSLWKSPPLIGEPSQYGIKLRNHPEKGLQALVSTDQAMYQINP